MADKLKKIIKIFNFTFIPMFLRQLYFTSKFFSSRGLLNHAASGAYYFIMSIVPITLVLFYFLNFFNLGINNVLENIVSILSQINPAINKSFFESIGLFNPPPIGTVSIISLIAIVWSSKYILSGIRTTFKIIFDDGEKHRFITDSLVSLITIPLIMLLAFIAFISEIIVDKLSSISNKVGGIFDNVVFHKIKSTFMDSSFMDSLFDKLNLIGDISFFANIFFMFILSYMLYKYLPIIKVNRSDVLYGSILFTILITFLNKVLVKVIHVATYYLVYGIISSVIVMLFWMHLFFIFLYFSAQFIYVRNRYKYLEIIEYFLVIKKGNGSFVNNLLFKNIYLTISDKATTILKGEQIFLKGDDAEYMYVILDGVVELNIDGKKAELSKDDFFGEVAVLDKDRYNYDAYSLTDCKVFKIDLPFYNNLLYLNKDFSKIILESLLLKMSFAK